MAETVLDLVEIGVSPKSSRGLTQSLTPIAASGGSIRRTINAVATDTTEAAFRKFASSISCSDLWPMALQDVYVGKILTVHCVKELTYKIPDPEEDPIGDTAIRPIVAGSLKDRGGYRSYRPVLTMMVMSFDQDIDEFGAMRGWSLELEEV